MISEDLQVAAKILNEEGIIGLPTETVYGLAGNIFSPKAIQEIFAIKQRPLNNPLIVHIKSMEDLNRIAIQIPAMAINLAEKFWPGPLTLVLKKNALVPDLVTSGKSTVAIRMPDHPMALSLLNVLDFPLAAPSANPFGMISPTQAQHVDAYFKDKMVLDGGPCVNGIESTIVGFSENRVIVYRLGSISLEDIKNVAGDVILANQNDTSPDAPGMFSKHYSPHTPLYFTDDIQKWMNQFQEKKIGILRFKDELLTTSSRQTQIILSPMGNFKEAASKLYNSLHQFDAMDLDYIIAEKFPEFGIGIVINDKLERASKNK